MDRIKEIENGINRLELFLHNKYSKIDITQINHELILSDMRFLIEEIKKLQKENKKLKDKGGKTNDKTRNKN